MLSDEDAHASSSCIIVRSTCAGPTGKILLMPEDPNSVFIMVATGTGIAPYRAFWRRQFMEDVPGYKCGVGPHVTIEAQNSCAAVTPQAHNRPQPWTG